MDVRMPDGVVVRGIPEGTPKDEIMAKYQARQGATSPSSLPAAPEEKGFLRRSGDALMEGAEAAKGRFDEWGKPTENVYDVANKAQAGPLAVSDLLGAGAEVVGDAAMSAGSAIIGDEASGWVGDKVDQVGQMVSESAPAEFAKEKWGQFEEAAPATAEFVKNRVPAALNTAGLMTPGKVTFNKAGIGNKLEKMNAKDYKRSRIDKTAEDLQPLKKKDRGNLDVDEKGNQKWEVTPFDEEMATEVSRVKEYNPHRSNSWNQARLRDEATKIRTTMEENIAKKGNPLVDKAQLDDAFDNASKSIRKDNRGILTEDVLTRAEELADVAREFVAKSDGTALGVLNARREFDRYIRNRTRGKAFDADFTNALDAANGVIRNALNDGVNASVKGVDVKNQLLRQHKLLSAHERLLEKAFLERETAMGRFVQNIENKTGMKIPTTPLAAGATVAAGGAVAAANPAVGGSLAALGTLYGGYKGAKWLGTPAGKQWLIKLTKAVEDDPFLSKYKIDKSILTDLMTDVLENPTEEEQQ